jgi:transposase
LPEGQEKRRELAETIGRDGHTLLAAIDAPAAPTWPREIPAPAVDRGSNQVIKIKFSGRECRICSSREQCIRSTKRYPRRTVTVRPKEQYLALKAARDREATPEFKKAYAKRAGIEGTISQGVRAFGLRRSRSIGYARTHLQHLLTAAAINFVRVDRWLCEVPIAPTRRSAFVTLMKAAA